MHWTAARSGALVQEHLRDEKPVALVSRRPPLSRFSLSSGDVRIRMDAPRDIPDNRCFNVCSVHRVSLARRTTSLTCRERSA
jgi:hypothetical protein